MHSNAKRDSDFPATSIGRSAGSRIHLQPHGHGHSPSSSAHEAHAHPLLSPGRSSSPTPSEQSQTGVISSHAASNGGSTSLGPQKYIPYTPRQRVTPTTTTTTVHPAPQHGAHQGGGGDATSRLQLMHLKAAAQAVGLDSGTLGWMMLERLTAVDGEREEEGWHDVWSAITSGKATLLLPLESAHAHEKLTADFFKDHVVLCDGPSRKSAPMITLSGLRGILEDETLTFRSTLNPHSRLFQDLMSQSTRTTALGLLPPLPLPISHVESSSTSTIASATSSTTTLPIPSSTPYTTSAYPHFNVPSYSSSLPLPPRSSQGPSSKPPLPPRPAKHPAAGSSTISGTATSATSRIPNPFASLFGGSSSSASTKSAASAPALAIPPSPPSSLRSLDSADAHPSGVVEISAFTIDRRIVRKDVAKEVNKTLKNELKSSLSSISISAVDVGYNSGSSTTVPIPSWVVERVHELTKDWYPFIKKPSSSVPSPLRKANSTSTSGSSGRESNDDKGGGGWTVNTFEENPEDVAQTLQDFYFNLEQDMRAGGTPFISRRKERERERKEREKEKDEEKAAEKGGSGGEEPDQERDKHVSERLQGESRIREVMEAVERAVTSLFYDRLFMQPTTDDASHDEALSNRIAALNMLDLGLGHLGIQVGSGSPSGDETDEEDEESEVDVVVKACGEMLSQLDTCRSPADKAAILVAAHKVVVDGLSRLPPIRLISENDAQQAHDRRDRGEEDEELKTAKPTVTTFPVTASSTEHVDGTLTTSTLEPPAIASAASDTATLVADQVSQTASFEANGPDSTSSKKAPPPPLPLDAPPSSVPPQPQPPSEPQLSPIRPRSQAKKDPTPVSGDVLLPLIIFSVVKSNPPHLVSNLLFTQRFRNQSVGGEESYCLINLMAVAEFLENVDMAGLGLGEVDKVVSTADLTPIPLTRSPVTAETPLAPADGLPGSLRGRVGQQVDAIADSANKVISGVVDSSFGILRSFMPDPSKSPALSSNGRLTPSGGTPGSLPKTGFGLLRRESGFSIASLAASLPVSIPGRAKSNAGAAGEEGQQLVTVSRPSSVKSFKLKSGKQLRVKVGGSDAEEEDDEEDEESVDDSEQDRESEEGDGSNLSGDEEESAAEEGEDYVAGGSGDARSIRSFESMLSASRRSAGDGKSKMSKARKSLSDRLASVSALAGRKTSPPPTSRRSSLQPRPTAGSPPASSRAASPSPVLGEKSQSQLRLPPPVKRFMECTADDLRLSEVGELLREYRRLVEGVRGLGGFDE